MSDHDLLVVAVTKLDALSASVNEMRASVSTKAEAVRVDKLETRLDATERKVYLMTGALLAIQAALKLLAHV